MSATRSGVAAAASIRRHLLRWLWGTLSAGALLIALATYLFALEEMNEALDEELHQVALTVLAHYQGGLPAQRMPAPAYARDAEDLEGLDFVTQVWTLDGERVFVSRPDVPLPLSHTEGFETVRVAGRPWRVYTDRSANYYTQAAQSVAVRERSAAEVALQTLLPMLAAVPLLSLLLAFALRRGLRPLALTAIDVSRRSAASLEPIDVAPLPLELAPLVASINALMARLADAIALQRQFTADAAHELRTPLSALRLQLDLLAASRDPAQQAAALHDARLGLARATRLVEQLLRLARLDPANPTVRRERVDLAALARLAVADFSARAEALGIDLGAAVEAAPAGALDVSGDAEQLRVLLNNLIDNALRCTPRGGKVDVRVARLEGAVTLSVLDSGPGIAEGERERVFQRFYRGAGTTTAHAHHDSGAGLGLAIVQAVARRHAASVELGAGLPDGSGPGLGVRVTLAAAA